LKREAQVSRGTPSVSYIYGYTDKLSVGNDANRSRFGSN